MTNDKPSSKKAILTSVVVLFLIAISVASYFSSSKKSPETVVQPKTNQAAIDTTPAPTKESKPNENDAAPTVAVAPTPVPTQGEIAKIDTSNWKTYMNKEYGYEIKYPKDWSVITREDYQVHFLAPETQKFDTSIDEPGEGNISIVMKKVENELNSDLPPQYSSKSIITLDGNSADEYEGVAGGQDPASPSIVYTMVYLVKDKKELSFDFADDIINKNDDKYLTVYYKMLTTFRFVN